MQREDILARVRSLAEQHTVLMSTHIVEDITESAQQLLALNEGRVVYDGCVHDLAGPHKASADVHRTIKDLISAQDRIR
ncbi:hypothetical protein FM125_04930 [Micrococcus lylae]|uniref:ABC transporter ATP-binding protein n=1 Tax=Micrococcus lylae TaxID=1273 RepID=A0A1R4IWV4_9MICC|nr:hypothetical protein FM125_04930 [Micrococcus lylae]